MKIKGAIFDMDGTLTESMEMWHNMAVRYLKKMGIEADEATKKELHKINWSKGCCILREKFAVNKTDEQIIEEMMQLAEEFYMYEVEQKESVEEFLQELQKMGVKMCVATATDAPMAEKGLEHCGLLKYFSKVLCVKDVGLSKESPVLYETALEHLGTDKNETWIFEDAHYAIKTAKNANFPVVGIYDSEEPKQEEIKELADIYIENYQQMLEKIR